MKREAALALLHGGGPVSFLLLDDLFRAFGFDSASPDFETEVYYHPKYRCGKFTARDDGLHLLTDTQKSVVLAMVLLAAEFEASVTPES